jgi:hypothetical protein
MLADRRLMSLQKTSIRIRLAGPLIVCQRTPQHGVADLFPSGVKFGELEC